MLDKNYRDIYVAIRLDKEYDTPTQGEKVIFITDDEVIDYTADHRVGVISNYVEEVDFVNNALKIYRDSHTVPTGTDRWAFANSRILERLDKSDGIYVATYGDFGIIYLGCYDLDEYDMFTMYADTVVDYIDDDDTFTLTEKGKELLDSIDFEELVSNVCDALVCDKHCVCPEESEENSTMDNLFGNLGFGKLRDPRFKLSMNGIAVRQDSGKYVVYNQDKTEFVDVTNTLFDIKDALFLLPAVEVAAGDTVIHEGKAYFIVDTTNEIKAVSYEDCTQTVLIPKSTMFGIKYFTKVFSMFGDNFASAGDLFSNPMMLMALMDGNNSDLTQLMLLNSLNNGDLGSNPMALAMMLKGDKSNDTLSTLALMSMFNGGTNPFAPKKKADKE